MWATTSLSRAHDLCWSTDGGRPSRSAARMAERHAALPLQSLPLCASHSSGGHTWHCSRYDVTPLGRQLSRPGSLTSLFMRRCLTLTRSERCCAALLQARSPARCPGRRRPRTAARASLGRRSWGRARPRRSQPATRRYQPSRPLTGASRHQVRVASSPMLIHYT